MNHINILKNKENPTAGIKLDNLDSAMKELPDWGKTGKATDEELKQQEDFVGKL